MVTRHRDSEILLPMRWHSLQHVPFEGPAALETWVRQRGYALSVTELWKDIALPQLDDFDGLFILGGPMNVYETEKYRWLADEQRFIARAVLQRKPTLGICLGAQLLAVVLGGKVAEMLDKEIGWFPVDLTPAGSESYLFRNFPDRFPAFHWHGDSFSIPPGAVHVARSEVCAEQGFFYENHAVGLQFHLESDKQSITTLLQHCGEDISRRDFIQDQYSIVEGASFLPKSNRLLFSLLDELSAPFRTPVKVDVRNGPRLLA